MAAKYQNETKPQSFPQVRDSHALCVKISRGREETIERRRDFTGFLIEKTLAPSLLKLFQNTG
jgi:hypothetical protein